MSDEELHPTLHTALNLDGSPEAIKKFYADWAEKYNEDTKNWRYSAPVHALYLLKNIKQQNQIIFDPDDYEINIMDAGCGTGFMGQTLADAGYKNIVGFDISQDMTDIAETLGIYNSLHGNIDINAPIPQEWEKKFDCTISVGVFTPGHVSPEALSQLAIMTRNGGTIIVSTRVAYCESENYETVSQQYEDQRLLTLIGSLKNASYTQDEKAHYWIYRVNE